MRRTRPFLRRIYIIGNLAGSEAEGMMLIEDNDGMPAVNLGYIRGRDTVLSPYAAKLVGGGVSLRAAELTVLSSFDAIPEVVGEGWSLLRASCPQGVEHRALHRQAIDNLDDALLANGLYRAKLCDEPGMHGFGQNKLAASSAEPKDPPEPALVFGGHCRDQRIQLGDVDPGPCRHDGT